MAAKEKKFTADKQYTPVVREPVRGEEVKWITPMPPEGQERGLEEYIPDEPTREAREKMIGILDKKGVELELARLRDRVSDTLSKSREEAVEEIAGVAGDVLRYETGMDIPVYLASFEDKAVSGFFNKILMRHLRDRDPSIADTAKKMSPEEITREWGNAVEESRYGGGEGLYTDRLRRWTELAETLDEKGLDNIACQIGTTRDCVADFAVAHGLEKFMNWREEGTPGETGYRSAAWERTSHWRVSLRPQSMRECTSGMGG